MLNVFILQLKRLAKKPLLILSFMGLTFLFVYFMGGAQLSSVMDVQTYSEDLTQEEVSTWLDRLNESSSINFEETDRETVEEDLRMNQTSYALNIEPDSYQFVISREDETLPVVEQHVDKIFNRYDRIESLEDQENQDIEYQEFLNVNHTAVASDGNTIDQGVFMLISMTFFFTIFSILLLQSSLLEEKTTGTWDRLIFLPISKTQLYLGHLLFYFVIGMFQIGASFFILTNVMGLNLGSNYFPMTIIIASFVFAIVALGILIVALTPTVQSLNVVVPLVATAMAMLGGAFWSIEIITSDILRTVAEFMPIKHAVYGMVDVIETNASITEVIQPIGILLLMGVLFMGIGINLMERKA